MKFPIKPWGPLDLANRYTMMVILKANHDAIHLMSFGFVSQANQIFDVLHSYDEVDFVRPDVKKLVHFAWQASEKWPQWLQTSSDDSTESKKDSKDLIPTLSLEHEKEKTRRKDGVAYVEHVATRHSNNFKDEVRKQLHSLSESSSKDNKRKKGDRKRNTTDTEMDSDSIDDDNHRWEDQDLQKLSELAETILTFPERQKKSDDVIIAGAVEAALELGEIEMAEKILEKHLVKRFRPHEQDTSASGVKRAFYSNFMNCSAALDSPSAWKFLVGQHHKGDDSRSDLEDGGWLAHRLGVTSEMVDKWLKNTLEILDDRLKNGRRGPYSHQSIRQLCTTFDDLTLKTKQPGMVGPPFSEEDLNEGEEPPKTLLHDPVTEDMLKEYEDRLSKVKGGKWSKGLPSQYKEFLLVTNGIYIGDDGKTSSEMLCPLSDTEICDTGNPFPDLDLLPVDSGINTVLSKVPGPDWPSIDDNIFIGAGGDEGEHRIIPKSALQKGIDYILKGWEAADDPYEKRRWNRAIRDILYIDLKGVSTVKEAREKMQDIDFVIIQGYHWRAEVICFRYFRELLEDWIEAMWKNRMENDDDDHENDSKHTLSEDGDGSDKEPDSDQEPPSKKMKK